MKADSQLSCETPFCKKRNYCLGHEEPNLVEMHSDPNCRQKDYRGSDRIKTFQQIVIKLYKLCPSHVRHLSVLLRSKNENKLFCSLLKRNN